MPQELKVPIDEPSDTSPSWSKWSLRFHDLELEARFQTYYQDMYGLRAKRILTWSCLALLVFHVETFRFVFYSEPRLATPTSGLVLAMVHALSLVVWSGVLILMHAKLIRFVRRMQLIIFALAQCSLMLVLLKPLCFREAAEASPYVARLQILNNLNNMSLTLLMGLCIISTLWTMQFGYYCILGVECILGHLLWHLRSLDAVRSQAVYTILVFPFVVGVLGLGLRHSEENTRGKFIRLRSLLMENSRLSQLNRKMKTTLDSQLTEKVESGMESVLRILSHMKKTATPQSKEYNELDSVIQTLLSDQDLFQVQYQEHATPDDEVRGWLKILETNYRQKRKSPRVRMKQVERTRSGIRSVVSVHLGSYFTPTVNETDFTPEVLMERVKTEYEINVFELSQKCEYPLAAVTMACLASEYIFNAISVPINNVSEFIIAIEQKYRAENPYHNAIHAAAVVLDVNYFIVRLRDGMSDLNTYAAMLAAAIHDVNHPGLTNGFLINTKSSLAITYSDDSVLERMHLAEAFQLTTKDTCNIFCNLTTDQARQVRQSMITMVLATDLALHNQHVNSLKSKRYADQGSHINTELVLQTVIMMADLGHATKSFEYHNQWSKLITEEFFRQGDLERDRNMTLSPLCDRTMTRFAKSQVGFFNYVVLPLFRAVQVSIPITDFSTVLEKIQDNAARWETLSKLEAAP